VLEALLRSPHEVVFVITHPPSDHEYETIWNDSVQALASGHGLPVVVRTYANDAEIAELVDAHAPDILVSSDWRTWLAPVIYQRARHGAINIHDALLPRYGGFAPLNWALVNGETEVGVTVHFMDDEFDAGDIVVQRRVPVDPNDTATDLFHKTLPLFPELALRSLELIDSGRQDWVKQDRSQATFFHKRSMEDSRIHWGQSPLDIVNLVRAQPDPYPNAFCFYQGERLQVLGAALSHQRYGGTPGRVFCRDGAGVVVVCGPAARTGREHGLLLQRVRTEDGRDLPAGEYFKRMGGYLTSHA
jgi:methionyl-tRNA formyltransferase